MQIWVVADHVILLAFLLAIEGGKANLYQLCSLLYLINYLLVYTVAKLSIATGHAMQIYNYLKCPRQL